jgi:hypothetical protein
LIRSSRDEQPSYLASIYIRLRTLHPNWHVEFGPRSGDGWIPGCALLNPEKGAFGALLDRIGGRLHTADRKIIAASFALRFGWSAGVAIAPFVLYRCVPDIGLNNISLRFSEQALFERVAILQARSIAVRDGEIEDDPLVTILDDIQGEEAGSKPLYHPVLLMAIRDALKEQTRPVIESLHSWSRFSKRALWGQVASSWGSQFSAILAHLRRHAEALEYGTEFFADPDFLGAMRPKFHAVSHNGLVRIYHRAASCCLYYRIPGAAYCASCPLVSDAERVKRNREWIDRGMSP